MSLYSEWKEIAEKERTKEEYDKFWEAYLEKEQSNYERILEKKESSIHGRLGEIADGFGMDPVTFAGFLDGINTSLVNEVELSGLNTDSEIDIDIDFKKLYFNMLNAKASWLYDLSQWESILSEDERQEIVREFNKSRMAVSAKVGRNDPCPCGSGKKYKKCCGSN